MKTDCIIVLICLLPLVLFSALQRYNPEMQRLQRTLLTQDKDTPINLLNGLPQLPYKTIDRNRNWRLRETTIQDIYDNSGIMQNNTRDILFYNMNNPARLDSIQILGWDNVNDIWNYMLTIQFTYDLTNEYSIEENWNSYDNPYPFIQVIRQYNNLRQLTLINFYNFSMYYQQMLVSRKWSFVYNNNCLVQYDFAQYDNISPIVQYARKTFMHDSQGRIIGIYSWNSSDSLNWQQEEGYSGLSYYVNDSSTGEDYMYFLSHNYLLDMFWQISRLGEFGSISEIIGYNTLGETDWLNNLRITYTYNASDLLISETYENYHDSWESNGMNEYSYDSNNNLIQVSWFPWDMANSTWGDVIRQISYTWEQTTPNNDEVTPEIMLSLSTYPNPFRSEINVNLVSKDNAPIEASIYNVKGQLIKQFIKQKSKIITWDGKDSARNSVSNGIYLIKVNQNGQTATGKIIRIN